MLKKLSTLCLGLSALAFAVPSYASFDPGFYITGQGGISNTHYNRSRLEITNTGSIDNQGGAGRAALGYQMDKYFGLELGYTHFAKTVVKSINGVAGNSGDVQQRAADLSLRAVGYFNKQWGVFGKLGAAYTKVTFDRSINAANGYKDDKVWSPTYGVGLVYDVNRDTNIVIGGKRVVHKNKSEDADFYYIGLSWSFAHWDDA